MLAIPGKVSFTVDFSMSDQGGIGLMGMSDVFSAAANTTGMNSLARVSAAVLHPTLVVLLFCLFV